MGSILAGDVRFLLRQARDQVQNVAFVYRGGLADVFISRPDLHDQSAAASSVNVLGIGDSAEYVCMFSCMSVAKEKQNLRVRFSCQ